MRKDYKLEFFLCLFLGFFGVHKFYKKKIGIGILYFFTAGILCLGWIYDSIILFNLAFLNKEETQEYSEIVKDKAENKKALKEEKLALKKEQREIEYNNYLQAREERRNSKEACCPRCGSTSLTANKKGWSLGKGLVGAALINPIGGIATGMLGKNKIIITCLKCGKQFKPGR